MPRCNCCGETKLEIEFPKNGTFGNGDTRRRPDCTTCYNIKRRNKKKQFSKFVGNTRYRTDEEQILSFKDWKECLIHFKGTCAYCGKGQSRSMKLTKEHAIPVVSGGKTVRNNIIPACVSCNCSKGESNMERWYKKQKCFSAERLERIKQWLTLVL